METLAALLTAFFLWLSIHVCTQGYRARATRSAGPLLVRLTRPRAGLRKVAAVAVLVVLLGSWGYTIVLVTTWDLDPFVAFGAFVNIAIVASTFPMLLGGAQLRQRGIVPYVRGQFAFLPWHHVKYCKWKRPPGRLFIQFQDHNQEFRIAPQQIDAANEVLVRYIEVRDESGKVLNPNLESPAVDLPEPIERRFQFSLRTLLLLVLVASCGFSWLGIRVRSTWAQDEALAKLEKFRPAVHRRFGNVVQLDFSASPSKPRDDDLAPLRELTGLRLLDLRGAPISDAGLAHLKGLDRLHLLVLSQTGVTDAGLVHLEELSNLSYVSLWGTAVTE